MSNEHTEPDLKTREDWLRQELRASRTLFASQLQWGVTVLAAVELNLYYVRRDVARYLIELGALKPNELLPITRWLIGTAFLIMLAGIFARYTKRTTMHHRDYRRQLLDMKPSYSGIEEPIPLGGFNHRVAYYLFFVFPAFDIFTWAFFYAGEKLNLHITIPW